MGRKVMNEGMAMYVELFAYIMTVVVLLFSDN
jgi:hypothetical protein